MMAMQMQGGLGYDDLNDLLKVRRQIYGFSRTNSNDLRECNFYFEIGASRPRVHLRGFVS